MTYTSIQLEVIKLFGRKELSFGCILLDKEWKTYRKVVWESAWYGYDVYTEYNIPPLLEATSIEWEHQYSNNCKDDFEILWHIPHLFPDVARELQKEWYVLELLKVDTIKSVLKISRFDIKKDIIISYKKLIPLLEQSEETLTQLISLFK